MAVEEFHFAPYSISSASSNPDFAVFYRHSAPYILEASAVNADESVFTNSINSYMIVGRDKPNNWGLRYATIYEVQAPAPVAERPQILMMTPYEIMGGKQNLTALLKVPSVIAYEIYTV